ncbi:UNVERIFIED_CONTAM: hypothetical protein ABIC26_000356 [Paenibacillus sp. PvR008]
MFYNTKGEKAFSLPAELKPVGDFHEQRAVVKNTKNNLYGYMNTKGTLVIPCQYTEANSFSEGKAKITIASTKENVESEYLLSDGLALAYAPNTGKIGFVNASGQLAIPFKYKYSRSFSDGLASVKNAKNEVGFIDKSGAMVIQYQQKYDVTLPFK